MVIDLKKFYLIDRGKIANGIFIAGALVAFFGAVHPWFLWPISNTYMAIAAVIIAASMAISATLKQPIFTEQNFLVPSLLAFVVLLYERIVHITNFSGYVAALSYAFLFYSLFRYKIEKVQKLCTMLAKITATFLIFSLSAFLLYLVGFSFPSTDAEYGFYSFTNHYLFLIDDRSLWALFPRFQSVCLEPAQLASACVLLLQTQRNHWKKWYNIVLLVSLLFSFSLGGYAYLVAILFLNLWTNRKKIFLKVLFLVSFLAIVITGSFFYNKGDNLVHNLILLRMEVDDGELAGNNRTSMDFDKEFDSYMHSDDIFFGRELEDDEGNSGYTVYIYRYGFVGLALILIFLFVSLLGGKDKRAGVSALIVALLIFMVDGFVMWYCRFLPLYATSRQKGIEEETDNDKEVKK